MDGTTLLVYANAGPEHAEFAQECWDQATAIVQKNIEGYTIPVVVLDRATLEVAANLFKKVLGDQENQQLAAYGAQPFRPALDPMTTAWPLLRPWMVLL